MSTTTADRTAPTPPTPKAEPKAQPKAETQLKVESKPSETPSATITAPPLPRATDEGIGEPRPRNVELSFDDKPYYKVQVLHDFNVPKAWEAFCQAHNFVSNKKGAFPQSFLGDLLVKYNCSELPKDIECAETFNLSIPA